jgi:hypothetical protein
MALMGALMGAGADLLRNDPVLAVDPLQVETPAGTIQGKFSIQSRGLKWEEVTNAPVALNKLEVEASLRMPETLFVSLFERQARTEIRNRIALRRQLGEEVEEPSPEQFEEFVKKMATEKLNSLIQQEFLVRDGDYLATVGSLSGGLLTVNGKTIALPTAQPPQPGTAAGAMEQPAPAAAEETAEPAAAPAGDATEPAGPAPAEEGMMEAPAPAAAEETAESAAAPAADATEPAAPAPAEEGTMEAPAPAAAEETAESAAAPAADAAQATPDEEAVAPPASSSGTE